MTEEEYNIALGNIIKAIEELTKLVADTNKRLTALEIYTGMIN